MFIQVDFGLVRDASGELQPKLVELQAFPSLYAYQPVLSQTYMDVFGLGCWLAVSPGWAGCGIVYATAAGCDCRWARSGERGADGSASGGAEDAAGFSAHREAAGRAHGLHHEDSSKEGRRLFYERDGKRIPIERIYNRAIVDELERKGVAAAV